MKKSTAFLRSMTVASLVAVLAAGCTPGSGSSSNSASNAPAAASAGASASPADSGKQVTLRFAWWGPEARHKATMDAINVYMQKNPNVKINAEYGDYEGYFQKLVTQLTGGTAPDVFQITDRWYYDLTKQKPLVVDLGTKKDIVKTDGIDPTFLKNQSYEGKLLAMPAGLNGTVLMYNKDFLDKNGIPEGTVWNWDNMIELGKKVHDTDKNQYLFSTDSGELGTLLRTYAKQLTGKQWINEDYTMGFDKAVATELLTFVKKLVDNGVAEPFAQSSLYISKSNENPKWIKGELGLQLKHVSLIPKYQDKINFKLGVAPLPKAATAKDSGVYTGSTALYAINSGGKNIDETAKFINWMINDKDGVTALGTSRGIQPAQEGRKLLQDAGKVDPLISSAMDTSLKSAGLIIDNGISQNQELDKILTNAIDNVGFGKMTPDKAADELVKLYELKLKDLKAQGVK